MAVKNERPDAIASPAVLWLLSSLPLISLVLVFWAYALPRGSEDSIVSLKGEWKAHVDEPGFEPSQEDTTGWLTLRLPGGFTAQGMSKATNHVWVRRTFSVPPQIQGQDSTFVLSGARGATIKAYLNGETIGMKGEPTSGFIGLETGATTFFVPAKLVRPEGNVMTLEVMTPKAGSRDGITDPRFLFGRYDVLGPWSFHESQVRSVIELGSLLLIAFLTVLLIALWRLQGARANKDLYRSSLLLMLAASIYLVGKSGFLVSAFLSGSGQTQVIVVGVHLLGIAIFEFWEAYYVRRVTWLRPINRAVSIIAVVFTVAGVGLAYRLYVNWLFLILVFTLVMATRDIIKPKTLFGPLSSMATFVAGLAALSDLLGDTDVFYAPRLFTFGVANLAEMAAAVVVAEFLQMAKENTRLSVSLQSRAEELADALVRAEESSRVKSEFLANTSHELRTPLNAIINIPQGLLEQFHEVRRARCANCRALFELEAKEQVDTTSLCPSCGERQLTLEAQLKMELGPEETSRLLKSIVRSGNHLLAVVNDILDYSKLEAGRVVLYLEKTSSDLLLEDLRLAMEPVATRAGVRLVVEGSEAITLDADRVKVSQVLINLVGNAIKFSDGKGTVTVKAAHIGQSLVISVRDEGIGIAPENQAFIFEGFRQVEGSNTRRFGGSGLGLAISQRLLHMHKGSIRVESALGAGSTFFIELPLVAPQIEVLDLSDAQVVVVVDDESSAVDTTSIALRPLGCQVVAVTDPREALAKLRTSKPALLILDVMMPRISGLELLRMIRADPTLSALPVLVSSAYPDNQHAVEELGATFIAKPWRAGELLRLATSLLAKTAIERTKS